MTRPAQRHVGAAARTYFAAMETGTALVRRLHGAAIRKRRKMKGRDQRTENNTQGETRQTHRNNRTMVAVSGNLFNVQDRLGPIGTTGPLSEENKREARTRHTRA